MKNTQSTSRIPALLFLLIAIVMTGCADAVNIEDCANVEPYGFFSGVWHGMILFFSFIGSLFSDDITVYAVNNTGGWYDFGYFIGLGGISFTASKSSRR